MGTSIAAAKMTPASWSSLEKIEPFTAEVKRQLEILQATRRVKVFPKAALSGGDLDKVVMAIWCVCYGGIQWRTIGLLSGLPFGTVYSCFARWERLGLWKALLADLLRRWREACGDTPEPSVTVVDSRSCRSAPTCGKRGIDGGKKVKGVKVSLAVDKHGLPLAVGVATANTHDSVAILPVLRELAANGHRGTVLGDLSYKGEALKRRAAELGFSLETKVCGSKGEFLPSEIRWVVERSFAWLSRYRRLNTIFERTDKSLVAFVQIAFISILASRFARLEAAQKLA